MDRNTPKPLTTEQAKDRLRAAAQHASPTTWFQHHPWKVIGIALASGFVVSRLRLPANTTATITRLIAPLMVGSVIRQLNDERSVKTKSRRY
jgi:hypothetical protein